MMNVLSRKLHTLENNILEFPPKDEDIVLHIGNADEQLLHDQAQKIRATIKDQAQAILNSEESPQQQNEAAKQLLITLTDEQNAILDQSLQFLTYRIKHLVYKWFAAGYPKDEDPRVLLRVQWFFDEMTKFNRACLMEDYEYNNHRNEDDPEFDDFAWWDALEAKKLELYPDGIFTEKSYEAVEAQYDIHLSRIVREYYEAHPQEREALIKKSNKALEDAKKSE
jgi:hypothetical protein